jgi:branched-chain amino acid transport system substrate-binding protein
MKRKNISAISIIIIFTVLLLTGCETYNNFKTAFWEDEENSDLVIRIGVFEPLSGMYQQYGELERTGIALAHELYPKVLGKDIELIPADNKSDIYIAETAIQTLITRNPSIVLGSYGSVYSLIAAPYLEEVKIPAIAITNTNWLVTSNNPYYFRVCFVYAYEGVAAAKYAVEEMDVSTAAILKSVTDDSAVAVSQAFGDKMIQLTGNENAIVSSQDFNPNDDDFRDQLRKIRNSGAEVVFLVAGAAGIDAAAEILIQAKEIGLRAAFLGTHDWETSGLIEKAGEAAEGIAFSTIFDPESGITEMTPVFLAAYKEKYGEDAVPHSSVALGFDAYMIAVEAIKKAGTSTDGDKIRKAIASTKEFPGASGSITFNEKGDPIKSVVIKTVRNGQIVSKYTVEPSWVTIEAEE